MTELISIMLVEDNKDDCEAIVRGFESCGFKHPIKWFNDSSIVLDYLLEEGNQKPTLILLDLNLPGVDGRSLLKYIKSHTHLRHIPIIAMTTSADQKDILSCYKHGACSYIQKPVNFNKMKEVCQSIVNYWFSSCLLPDEVE